MIFKKKKKEDDGEGGKKEKVSHNNGLIPTYETNKKNKLIRQKTQKHKRENEKSAE